MAIRKTTSSTQEPKISSAATQALPSEQLSAQKSASKASSAAGFLPQAVDSQAVLNLMLQTGQLPLAERKKIFRRLVQKLINHPSHPCAKLEKEVKEEMVESIAGVLAESPDPHLKGA